MTRASVLPVTLTCYTVVIALSSAMLVATSASATTKDPGRLRGRQSLTASTVLSSSSSSSPSWTRRSLQSSQQGHQTQLPGGPGVFLLELSEGVGPATGFDCSVSGAQPEGSVSCSLSQDGWYGIVVFDTPSPDGSTEVSTYFSQDLQAEQMWRVEGRDISSPSFDPDLFPLRYAAVMDATLQGTAMGSYVDLSGFRLGYGSEPHGAWWIGGDDGFWSSLNATSGLEWAETLVLRECDDVPATCVVLDAYKKRTVN